MPTSLLALLIILRSLIRSRIGLQLENLALRHQIGVLQRSLKTRPKITTMDRLFWTSLSRIWRDWRSALVIVKPETVVAWHRMGFRLFWAWKVRRGQAGTRPHPTLSPAGIEGKARLERTDDGAFLSYRRDLRCGGTQRCGRSGR